MGYEGGAAGTVHERCTTLLPPVAVRTGAHAVVVGTHGATGVADASLDCEPSPTPLTASWSRETRSACRYRRRNGCGRGGRSCRASGSRLQAELLFEACPWFIEIPGGSRRYRKGSRYPRDTVTTAPSKAARSLQPEAWITARSAKRSRRLRALPWPASGTA